MANPSRKPTPEDIESLPQQLQSPFFCGPYPWRTCECGSHTFEVYEFGRPYRCTGCRKDFTDLGV